MSEKKYKIAICFSGQPRYITEGAYWNHKNWIQPFKEAGHEVDIFCHSWDSSWAHVASKDGLKKYIEEKSRGSARNIYVKENRDLITKQLVESHNPKAIRFDDFHKTSKSILHTNKKIFGQHISAILSNDLSKKYEEEHSFKYDLKIRLRYDAVMVFKPKHVLQNMIPDLWEDEIIYVQGFWKWGSPSKDATWCIQDKFLISRGYIIDEVMNMDHLIQIKDDGISGQNTIWFYLVDRAQWRVREGPLPSPVIRQCIFDDNPDYKTWTEEQLRESCREWRRLIRGRGARARVGGKK